MYICKLFNLQYNKCEMLKIIDGRVLCMKIYINVTVTGSNSQKDELIITNKSIVHINSKKYITTLRRFTIFFNFKYH